MPIVVVSGLTAAGHSLGLSVDCSANLAHYFAVARETKKEAHPRAHHDDSVWRLALSVFHGAFSTFVACCCRQHSLRKTVFQMFFKMLATAVRCMCVSLPGNTRLSPCGLVSAVVAGFPWVGPRHCSPLWVWQ